MNEIKKIYTPKEAGELIKPIFPPGRAIGKPLMPIVRKEPIKITNPFSIPYFLDFGDKTQLIKYKKDELIEFSNKILKHKKGEFPELSSEDSQKFVTALKSLSKAVQSRVLIDRNGFPERDWRIYELLSLALRASPRNLRFYLTKEERERLLKDLRFLYDIGAPKIIQLRNYLIKAEVSRKPTGEYILKIFSIKKSTPFSYISSAGDISLEFEHNTEIEGASEKTFSSFAEMLSFLSEKFTNLRKKEILDELNQKTVRFQGLLG